MRFLILVRDWVTFAGWRARRRRRNYDELKALIVEEHLSGRGGMVVPRKFKFKEIQQSFRAPMYYLVRDEHDQLCLVWRKDLMSEEVGSPRVVAAVASAVEGH